MTEEEKPFNPLDKRNLGESVARAMLQRPIGPLPPPKGNRFEGAGIYAIYYTGDFELYAPIAERNRDERYEQPIYVGKAVPKGTRKGGFGLDAKPGTVLFDRLREHANSIKRIGDLRLEDFSCRYLVSDDIWIPLGESLLIETFNPLWNRLVDGYGNHDPGSGRKDQQRSKWDALHVGRKWAEKLQPNEMSREDIMQLVRDFFAGKDVPLISVAAAVMEDDEEG